MVRPAVLLLAIGLLIAGAPTRAAEIAGVVTILEGDAVAIRGLSQFALAEGTRVLSNDLLQTGKNAFVRVEFTDGAIVDLGPASRAQANRPTLRRFDRPAFYLLSGWLKFSATKLGKGAKGAIASPQFDALALQGETVLRVEGAAGEVFAESGPLQVIDRRHSAAATIALKSGDFVTLRNEETVKVFPRPARDFVAALPRPFEDLLPSRVARFQGREVPAKPTGAFSYAEVEPWLDAEPMIRRRFVREWAEKANEPAFREKLDVGLARHPEWERVLYPERFEPKQPAPVASMAPAPAAGLATPANASMPPNTPAGQVQGRAPSN